MLVWWWEFFGSDADNWAIDTPMVNTTYTGFVYEWIYWLYVCMHVCMCVRVNLCMCVWMRACRRRKKLDWLEKYALKWTNVCTLCMYICMYVCMYVCVCTKDIHCKNDNFLPKIAAENTAVVRIFTFHSFKHIWHQK